MNTESRPDYKRYLRAIWFVCRIAAIVGAFRMGSARADIFEWKYYYDDFRQDLKKIQSQILVPDGAGLSAVPGADLSSKNLTRAYLMRKDLTNTDFSFANLTDAAFGGEEPRFGYSQTKLDGANFTEAILRNADFKYLNIAGADFAGADIRGADLSYSKMTMAQLQPTASYQNRDLSGINLYEGASQYSINLRFNGIDLSAFNLANANLSYNILLGADLSGAIIHGANLSDTSLTAAQLRSTASYQAADLHNVQLSGNNLNLANENLAGFNFAGSDLQGAVLTNANFSHANLTNANLGGLGAFSGIPAATLSEAGFADARIQGANFTATQLNSAQLYSTQSYQAHDLTGVKLAYVDVSGWNFADARIEGASFIRGYFSGGGLTTEQLYSTLSYQTKSLSGVALGGNDLAGFNCPGCDLSDSSFYSGEMYSLRTNLTGADLRQTNLERSMIFADLTGANLAGANLTGAQLSLTYCCVAGRASALRDANLSGANLKYAFLEQVDFRNANLSHADLRGAIFTSFDSDFPDYTPTDFRGADLSGADLRGEYAYFGTDGANTRNAILPENRDFGGFIPGGLVLGPGEYIVLRNAPSNTRSGIFVTDCGICLSDGALLRVEFDADPWTSYLVSYGPPVFAGTLELDFEAGVDVASQVGQAFQLFRWSGRPMGTFTVTSPYVWDVSKLYTTGEVTLLAVPEPATPTLVLIGSLAFALRRRNRMSDERRLAAESKNSSSIVQ